VSVHMIHVYVNAGNSESVSVHIAVSRGINLGKDRHYIDHRGIV
jgi:hypothetical protein